MRPLLTSLFIFLALSPSRAQNVGIGTNAPTQKLDINGTIRIRQGNPATGKVLASDANGNASWQGMESLSGQSVGFGSWGDCNMSNISHYNPVSDIDTNPYTNFGHSVFVFGDFAIVGAPRDDFGSSNNNTDQGSASIFEFDGTNWILKQKLTDATGAAGDLFGTSVSINQNFAFVGAPLDDVGANTDQGSVSIFQYDGNNWVLLQKLTEATGLAGDNFGASIWLDDLYAMIGAPLDDVGANNSQGSVIFFKYSGPNWTQSQKITDPAGTASDFFGAALCLSGNTMVVGAYNDGSSGDGAAFVFSFDGSVWSHVQKLTKPFASTGPNTHFGSSVAIQGQDILIGSPGDDLFISNQGIVYEFGFNGTNYQLRGRIEHPEAAADDRFGNALHIAGKYLIIGCVSDDINFGDGAAIIYQRVGRSWQRFQYTHDPAGQSGDQFGYSVSINKEGQFLIGAPIFGDVSGKAIFGKLRL